MIDEVKKIVAKEKDEIRKQFKTEIIGIFGSYARGDNNPDSDLDLLIDLDASATLFDLVGVQLFFEDKLGCKVDVVTRGGLRDEIQENVYIDLISL